MAILKEHYPNEDHVLVFDNATTHNKRPDDSLSARRMPLGPSRNFFVEKTVRDDRGRYVYGPDGKPLKEKIKGRVFPPANVDLEDISARRAYVRRHTRTEYHPIGTAGLGRVVDSNLKVLGVGRLRVVDASVFPLSVSGNIMAPVYALAEKAADIIKKGHQGDAYDRPPRNSCDIIESAMCCGSSRADLAFDGAR